jgi:3-oxoadipate enol-lactonase
MPYADCGSARLYFEFGGPDDRPVLVLANSLGTNLHMWDDVVPRLASEYRVLRYDMRGHGSSSVPARPYSLADLGNDLLSLLDELGIVRCNFCGISIGGLLGMCLGIHAPHRVEKLILANTAARIGTEAGWNERISQVLRGGVASIADAGMERWFSATFRQNSPAKVAAIREMLAATSPEGYAGCCAALRDADMTANLHRLRAPSLIVAGELDPATTPTEARVLAQRIAEARLVELPTAHLSPVELPEEFSSAVLHFLNARDETNG